MNIRELDGPLLLKAVNSRVGLLLIFIAYTSSPWGLGAKLDELIRNTDRLQVEAAQTRQLEASTHEIIIRLEERCLMRGESMKTAVAKR